MKVPPGTPPDLAEMLSALLADPGDAFAQGQLCDWLEDHRPDTAALARACRPDAEEVAKAMYPDGMVYEHVGDPSPMFEPRDGRTEPFPLYRIGHQLAGKYLLVDPAVEAAARVLRGRALLRLVLGD